MISTWKGWVAKVGEKRLVLWVIGISLLFQFVFLRAPIIYGEPYLIAKNIVAGKGFVFTYPLTATETVTCYATPLFTFIQTGILWLGLGDRGIQIFNILILQAAFFVIYRFCRRFVAADLAIPAYFALAMYAPLWVLADALDPNSLNVLLVALTVDILYQLSVAPSRRLWVWLGVLFGLQLLVRPDILLGSVLFAAWLLYIRRHEFRATLKHLVLSALLGLAIVAPWTIRNYVVFHRFVLVSANAGFNLFVGNNPGATGEFAEMPDASPDVKKNYEEFVAYSRTHDQVEMDQYRFEQAKRWIMDHPWEVVLLDLKKFSYHWFGRADIGSLYHFAPGMLSTIYKGMTAVMLLLGIYALLLIPDRKIRGLLVTLALYSTLISMIFFVQSRHRILKIDPFLVPLATIGLVKLATRRTEHFELSLQISE